MTLEQPGLGLDPPNGSDRERGATSMEEGVPTARPPNVEEVGMGAPSGVVTAPAPLPKSIGARPSKKRLPDRVLVDTPPPPISGGCADHPTEIPSRYL